MGEAEQSQDPSSDVASFDKVSVVANLRGVMFALTRVKMCQDEQVCVGLKLSQILIIGERADQFRGFCREETNYHLPWNF